MEHCLNLPNRYAMILDTEAIKSVIAHAAELKLPRRECRPLDRYRGKCANAALAKYDAEVDAAPLANEELDIIEAVVEAVDASVPENADFADDDF
ncbi:MAG: hypothetical protein ACTS6J_09740 [Burkholderiales bacterium]